VDANQRQGLLWASSAAICIGVFSVPWKAANTAGDPLVSTLVLLLSAATFSTLLTVAQQRRLPRFRRFDLVAASVLAVLTLAGNLASAHAIQSISSPVLTVVQRTEVLVVALLAWPFLGERVERRFWLGAAIAAVGLVVLRDPFAAEEVGAVAQAGAAQRAEGIALAAAAASMFGCMALFTRRVIHQIDPVVVNGLRLWISVGFWFALNGVPDALREAPRDQIFWAALTGFIGPFFGRLSMMLSARHLEARKTVLMTLAAPPVTLVVAVIALGDWPSGRELAGGVVMLMGVAIPLFWPSRAAPADPVEVRPT